MGIFGRKASTSSNHSGGSGGKVKVELTKEDAKNYKIRTGSVHDPILAAVNEAQPFEQTLEVDESRKSYAAMVQQQGMFDVFGKPIQRPDISNPTRSRDERPLDTIRGFEYSITGDTSYRDRLESDSLGFRVRDDFPRFSNGNPYGYNANANGGQSQQLPVHSFSGDQQAFEQGIYEAPAKTEDKPKKKRGLFGRKK